MSQNTTNYNLKKAELTDAADITALNANWDTIDSTMKTLSDGKANASHNHNASAINAGTLPVEHGGTGLGTLTSGSYLVGNGAGNVTLKTPSEVLEDIGANNIITGAATTIVTNNLTVSRAVVSNSSGKIAVSNTTSTELGYLSGVTSSVQGQLNGKQDNITYSNTDLTAGTSELATGTFYAYYE